VERRLLRARTTRGRGLLRRGAGRLLRGERRGGERDDGGADEGGDETTRIRHDRWGMGTCSSSNVERGRDRRHSRGTDFAVKTYNSPRTRTACLQPRLFIQCADFTMTNAAMSLRIRFSTLLEKPGTRPGSGL
jgi:hypothetical protein